MFRSLVLVSSLTAVVAGATCTDTLYVSGLKQFTLSFRDVRTDHWDSSEVSASSLGDARSLSMAPILDTSEIQLPIQFQSNCGGDSLDAVKFLRARDIGATVRGQEVWTPSADTLTRSAKAVSYGAVKFSGISVKGFWEVDGTRWQIGMPAAPTPSTYMIQFATFRFSNGNGSYSYSGYRPYASALREMAFDDVSGYLDQLSGALDSVGHGLDSVRVSARITEAKYSYEPTQWSLASTSNVHKAALRSPAFGAYRTTSGYRFVLPRPVALSILSPDGRVVRELPAATLVNWDGRDAKGVMVPRGVYFVRALGLGAVRIPAP
ncbi:MAG: hypothetical protein H6686_09450 [Fibrobacteria bacterium]|nr:hypothetical protein [Fibrobacteria bacterium]